MQQTTAYRRLRNSVAILGLVALLAGCGKGEEESASTAPAAGAAPPPAAPPAENPEDKRLANAVMTGKTAAAVDLKYDVRDHRGGGRASARETVARVAAGAVAKQLLATFGCRVVGWVRQVGNVVAEIADRILTHHLHGIDLDPRAADSDQRGILTGVPPDGKPT